MSRQLTTKELSEQATAIHKNKAPMPTEELQRMYENRVLMADFLAAKGIPIRCKANPGAKLDGGSFSLSFRRLAAEQGCRDAYVKSATTHLLWSVDFLNKNLDQVKEKIIADVKVDLFGDSE